MARAAFPKGALAMRVRDELGEVFADGAFIDAFGVQYCLGLALTDPGFDFSVLSQSRTGLIDHDLQRLAFEILLDRLVELELVQARGRQRTVPPTSWPRSAISTASK